MNSKILAAATQATSCSPTKRIQRPDEAFRQSTQTMKLLHAAVLAFLALCLPATAQTISGAKLIIDVSGTTQSVVDGSAVIGDDNEVYGSRSLAVGSSNRVAYTAATFGTNNKQYSYGGLSAGGFNEVGGNYTVGFGFGNYVGATENALVAGKANSISGGGNSFVAGQDNLVGYWDPAAEGGDGWWADIRASITLGNGLVNNWSNSVIVGRFNDTSLSQEPIFVVGNGVSASERSNALEIYKNGKILMPRQGDILMGEFGEAE